MAFLSRGFKNLQWYSMTKSRHPIWDAVIFCGAERFELKIGTVHRTVPAASANTGGFYYFGEAKMQTNLSYSAVASTAAPM